MLKHILSHISVTQVLQVDCCECFREKVKRFARQGQGTVRGIRQSRREGGGGGENLEILQRDVQARGTVIVQAHC